MIKKSKSKAKDTKAADSNRRKSVVKKKSIAGDKAKENAAKAKQKDKAKGKDPTRKSSVADVDPDERTGKTDGAQIEQQPSAQQDEWRPNAGESSGEAKPEGDRKNSIDMGIAANFFAGGGVHEIESEALEESKEPEDKGEVIDLGIAQAFFAGGGVTEIFNDDKDEQPTETLAEDEGKAADIPSEQQRQLEEEQRILEEQAAQNPDDQYYGSSLVEPDDAERQMEEIINEQGYNGRQEAYGGAGEPAADQNQADFEEALRNAEQDAEGEIGFKETSGAHLGEVEGVQDDNKTEIVGEGAGFFSEAQNDNFTDIERLHPDDPNQHDVGKIGFMDDETEIQPNNTLDIQKDQQQEVIDSWEDVKKIGIDPVGKLLMKNIFSIEPGALQLYSFRNVPNLYNSPELKKHYTKLISSLDKAISMLYQTEQLAPYLKTLGKRHVGYGVQKEHYNVVGRALLLTLEAGLKEKFTPQLKQSWVALIRTVSASMISDNYETMTEEVSQVPENLPPSPEDEQQKHLKQKPPMEVPQTPPPAPEEEKEGEKPKKDMTITLQRRMLILKSWKQLTKDPELGLKVFINIFTLAPGAVKLFSFRNVKNLFKSYQLKTHGDKIIQIFGQVVANLDNLEYVKPTLALFGEQHIGWHVKELHFDVMAQAVIMALKEDLGDDFTPECQDAWVAVYNIITEIMLTHFDREENLFKNIIVEKEGESPEKTGDFKTSASSVRNNKSGQKAQDDQASSNRGLIDEDGQSIGSYNAGTSKRSPSPKKVMKKHDSLASIQNEVWQHYKDKFRVEVDFHHKICYRFESAYRLSYKSVERKKNLNLQIIDCIGEFSGYIEQDPMALFYCLYFCIFFKNEELVEFLRQLIHRIKTTEKIDRLLELIDTHGIERLRQIGEQINQYVYHMVFYQAVDDNLRIVYAQIFKQLRFIQLRDKDALQLLNQRDYELIKLSFEKYTVKINLLQFYKKAFPLKASTYRKYNQAYFEEIVINNEIEQRVAMNYRERFLVTKEDIYIVFEMYCKEDYDEQFKKTKKDEITKKQFVDLFIICIRNDSFKIAMLIYTLYLNPQVDMDGRMMDILMNSIKESIKFHELKLFFLHEHFNVLSISQLNQLLDIYQDILRRKEAKTNPMISQFNTIKITLLIYRICWKIEERQIYSLITKCSVLQHYLIQSLSKYFEMQNNILVLYKFMSEPILHMTERKDSLDIMYEMNMSELLQHPVVVEVLNLVYEGKYSVSSSALSMIQTFYCLIEMDTVGLKSITERLTQNIFTVGDLAGTKQSSLQYNIWKQSIQQREQDEMFFTVLNNSILLVLALVINLINNHSYDIQKEVFGPTFQKKKGLFLAAEGINIEQYCEEEVDSMLSESTPLSIFTFFVILTAIGSFTSFSQKFLTFRFKDNVKLSIGQMLLEFSIAVTGVLYMISYSGSELNTVISDHCSNFIEISPSDKDTIDLVYTLRDPATQKLNFKLILSVIIIQSSISLILMLKRTQHLGELIMMLAEMMDELIRFFATFGLAIGLILVIGSLMGSELKEEKNSTYQLFLDLFNAFNGNQEFQDFKMPIGQIYIGTFMYIFKVLLLSLLAAMFINKYEEVYKNLDAHRRFNIIKMKNSVAYDKHVGGATLTFFPINILVLLFMIPIFSIRSSRASDFALKIQYVVMVLLYGIVICVFVVPTIPILYVKCLINTVYIGFTRKREDFKGQNIKQAAVTVFLGPLIISLSLLIDLITITSTLLKPGSSFEHKYQLSEHRLNEQQMTTVLGTLTHIFANYEQRFKGHTMTLEELMIMHVRIFKIIDNLHDLTCKGLKNYKAALSNVQDYNMTKVLSEKCSIPAKNGEYKDARCEIDQIYFVSLDIELYNHIDVLLRKLRLGTLRDDMTQMASQRAQEENEEGAGFSSKKKEAMKKAKMQKAKRENKADEGEEEDEEQVIEGIAPYDIGPDGVPLKRNSSDVMNNFCIDYVARSFTDIELSLMAERVNQDYKRSKKMAAEIEHHQHDWKSLTAGLFTSQAEKYQNHIRDQMYTFKLEQKSKAIKNTNVKGDRFDKKSAEETSVGTGQ